jgi:hypothetical protein
VTLSFADLRSWLRKFSETLPADIRGAHEFSSHHRSMIAASTACGCFYCLAMFSPSEVREWTDSGETALCPNCGIDAVLPGRASFPLDRGFLQKMNAHWFGAL